MFESDSIRLYIPIHNGIHSKPGYGFNSQLFGDILAVSNNRGQADIEFIGYLFINVTFANEHKYFNPTDG